MHWGWAEKFVDWCHMEYWWMFDQWDSSTATPLEEMCNCKERTMLKYNPHYTFHEYLGQPMNFSADPYIYIYIYIVIHRQTVLFYQNSSMWLYRLLWIYLHWGLYQEYLDIWNLNNLFVLTELFPTPDLLDWRIYIYIYIYIYILFVNGCKFFDMCVTITNARQCVDHYFFILRRK